PSLAALLGADGDGTGAPDDLHLTPIDLDDGTATAVDPLSALASVQWPDLAAGGAIACDLAPTAWTVREEAGGRHLDAGRRLRVVVAALADGPTRSAVQPRRSHGLALLAALLPEISSALIQTLTETG